MVDCSFRLNDKILGLANICIGLLCLIFQIAFYSSAQFYTNFDQVGTGIWGGIIFIATGGAAFLMATRESTPFKLHHLSSLTSFALTSGIILLAMTAASIDIFNNYSSGYTTELALDSMLLIFGIFAIFINVPLLLFVLTS